MKKLPERRYTSKTADGGSIERIATDARYLSRFIEMACQVFTMTNDVDVLDIKICVVTNTPDEYKVTVKVGQATKPLTPEQKHAGMSAENTDE